MSAKTQILITISLAIFAYLSTSFPTCVNDPSSYTNCDQISTTNIILNFTVDFDNHIFVGSNTLNLTVQKDDVT